MIGFVGSYITAILAKQGYQVIIPWRKDEMAIRDHMVYGDIGQMVPMRFDSEYYETIRQVCARSNVVINAAGRRFDKYGDTMEKANLKFAQDLANACNETGVERHILISNINAHPDHPSKSLSTKGKGEQIVQKIYPETTIIRATDAFGMEDKFLNFYAKCLRIVPGAPIVHGGQAKVQPLFVGDIGKAVAKVLSKRTTRGKTYHLGGRDTYTLNGIIEKVSKIIDEDLNYMPLPVPVGHALGLINEYTWTPIFTRDFIHRVQYDNVVPQGTEGFEALGIDQIELLDDVAPTYLSKWKRKADYFMDVNTKNSE